MIKLVLIVKMLTLLIHAEFVSLEHIWFLENYFSDNGIPGGFTENINDDS